MRIHTFISLLFIPLSVHAQHKWTLEECIEYAIEHNVNIKQSEYQTENLRIQRSTLKNNLLPKISAEASQKFAFGRSLNQNNMYESSNIQNTAFSINAEIPLFTGFKNTASITQNKYRLLAAEAETEEIRNSLLLNITTAYFQILLYHEIYQIAEEQINQTKEQITKTEFLIENGKVPQSQLYDVKAQLADDELAATEAKSSLRLAQLELTQLMEWNKSSPLELDTVNEIIIAPIDTLDTSQLLHKAQSCMPQVRKAAYSVQSCKEEIKIAKSGYYPSVILGANIHTGYYHSDNGINDFFRNQLKNNLQKSIYISLSIPLFNGFSIRNQIRSARITYEKSLLSMEEEKKVLEKNIERAYVDALSAYEKYLSTSKAVVANQEAYRYAKEKYYAGKSSVFEYNEIKIKLAEALSLQSQAKYSYLLKRFFLRFYAC